MSEPQRVEYQGLLVIGDPHLAGRQPGFRKDDYPQVTLDKLGWCLDYAAEHALLPALLGDLFERPRDNPVWLLGRLIEMLHRETIGLYGNHDCADPLLCEHDSLNLLVKAGRLRLVDERLPWRGNMAGRPVVVGGSSYRQFIPNRFRRGTVGGQQPLVIWLTHHDLVVPGYDAGRFEPREIDGIDIVINGHIHRRLPDVQTGKTLWLTPGNISRIKRNDIGREHVPAVLRIDVTALWCERRMIEVPHRPFAEVFHEQVEGEPVPAASGSAFVAGLAELQARRTAGGAGLMEYLDKNLSRFEPAIAEEIMVLAQEVNKRGEDNA